MNDFSTAPDQKVYVSPLSLTLTRQRQAYLEDPEPCYQQRVDDLLSLKKMLVENRTALTDAISRDYGSRSWHETTFAEFIAVLGAIDHLKKHLKRWMSPQNRSVDHSLFPGAKNRVIPQPLGVVGIIVPWNFPLNLSMIPVATALAAGNRALVKMSENSAHLSRVLKEIASKYFFEEKLSFFEETGQTGIEFSSLPLDLLVFTGSPQTGRSVMAAAAQNLTPVLLELGGKCPAIIDNDYSIEKSVHRIMYAKQFNAGQVCLNVDYVFVPEHRLEAFIETAKKEAKKLVPDINSHDYTSIIDQRSMKRLKDTLEDARQKGARIVNLSNQSINEQQKKFPLHLVLDVTPDMQISQREIFGPILMVKTYKSLTEAINSVNSNPRPLALYIFTDDNKIANLYISRIMSGGVSVNETMLHAFQDDIPFGGVGHSGIGHYHGYEGFVSFSKMRPVFYQSKLSPMSLLAPPYPAWLTKAYNVLVSVKS